MKSACVVLLLPAALLAAVPASDSTPPQNVRQDVNRLTLLPGPYLTSPAKGAPQPKPVLTTEEGMVKIGGEPAFESKPSPPPAATPGPAPNGVGAKPKEFVPKSKATPPNPDNLRFDAQLAPSVNRSILERPKPDAAATPAPEVQFRFTPSPPAK